MKLNNTLCAICVKVQMYIMIYPERAKDKDCTGSSEYSQIHDGNLR